MRVSMKQMKTKVKEIRPLNWESCEIDKQMESKHSIQPYLESLKTIELNVLWYFNGLRRTFKNMYVCQQRIADKFGVTREYICKVIGRLTKLGLIHKLRRFNSRTTIKGTSRYRLPLIFNYKYVTDALFMTMTTFNFLGVSLLASQVDHANSINALAECFPSEFTQLNLNLKETTITTVSSTVTERERLSKKDTDRKNSITYLLRNKPKPQLSKQEEERRVIFTQEARQSGPISPVILEDLTKILHLTPAGQVRFTSFPDDVIREALAGLKKAKGIKTPYAWTLDVCKKICLNKGLRPDWGYSRNLKYTMQIPESEPEFVTALPKTVVSPFSKASDYVKVSVVFKKPIKQQQNNKAPAFDATQDKTPWHKCVRLNDEIEKGTRGLVDYMATGAVINPLQDMMIKLMESMIKRWTAELDQTIKEIDQGLYGIPDDWSDL